MFKISSVLQIDSVPSTFDALAYSADGRYAVVTESNIRIFKVQNHGDLVLDIIPATAQEDDGGVLPNVPFRASSSGGFKRCAWSPLHVAHNGGCLLSALTLNHRALIFENPSRLQEYQKIGDVEKVVRSFLTSANIEKHLWLNYLDVEAIAWHESTLVLGTRSGHLIPLTYSNKGFSVLGCFKVSEQSAWISSLEFLPPSDNVSEVMALVGCSNGAVFIYAFTASLESCVLKHTVCEADRKPVHILKSLCSPSSSETRIFIVKATSLFAFNFSNGTSVVPMGRCGFENDALNICSVVLFDMRTVGLFSGDARFAIFQLDETERNWRVNAELTRMVKQVMVEKHEGKSKSGTTTHDDDEVEEELAVQVANEETRSSGFEVDSPLSQLKYGDIMPMFRGVQLSPNGTHLTVFYRDVDLNKAEYMPPAKITTFFTTYDVSKVGIVRPVGVVDCERVLERIKTMSTSALLWDLENARLIPALLDGLPEFQDDDEARRWIVEAGVKKHGAASRSDLVHISRFKEWLETNPSSEALKRLAKIIEASDCSRALKELIMPLWNQPTNSAGADDLKCPICAGEFENTSFEVAKCANSHVLARCCDTYRPLLKSADILTCGCCGRKRYCRKSEVPAEQVQARCAFCGDVMEHLM